MDHGSLAAGPTFGSGDNADNTCKRLVASGALLIAPALVAAPGSVVVGVVTDDGEQVAAGGLAAPFSAGLGIAGEGIAQSGVSRTVVGIHL